MQAALQWEANKELPFSHSSVNAVRVYSNLQAGEDLTLFLQVFAPRSLKRSPVLKVLKYFLSPSLLLSAGPHQPHQHLPYARWNSGHVKNGRPQHAGRLHPLSCLGALQHQVSRSASTCLMAVITPDCYDPADDGADESDYAHYSASPPSLRPSGTSWA